LREGLALSFQHYSLHYSSGRHWYSTSTQSSRGKTEARAELIKKTGVAEDCLQQKVAQQKRQRSQHIGEDSRLLRNSLIDFPALPILVDATWVSTIKYKHREESFTRNAVNREKY